MYKASRSFALFIIDQYFIDQYSIGKYTHFKYTLNSLKIKCETGEKGE